MIDNAVAQRRQALETNYPQWVPRTTAQLLDRVADAHPRRRLVLGEDSGYNYADVAAWSRRLAAGLLAIGVQAGDHVAVDMANLPEVVALKFAVARIGAVSVSVNYLLRHEELRYVLDQSDSVVLITMDRFRDLDYLDALDQIAPGWEQNAGGETLPRLRAIFVHGVSGDPARGRPLAELIELGESISDDEVRTHTAAVDPDSNSDLLYTSGTTGQAKGVLLRHDAVVRVAYACAYTHAFRDQRRILYALPIYHVFGYIEGLIASLFVGGAVRIHASFDADTMLREVTTYQIDELMCVPAMTSALLDAARTGDYDLTSLRTMFTSGAAHAPGMWQDIYDLLGVEEIFTAYGQTETTASTTCTLPGDTFEHLSTTNGTHKPAGIAGASEPGGFLAVYKTVHSETGEDLAAGETGELLVRGPIVTRGYYNKPEETAAVLTPDGWLRTGDIGRVDEHGYLTLTGRKKESYRFGGELVMPAEVERVLQGHPGVQAAHIVGIPHHRMGEVGCAWIVAGPDRPTAEELLEYCATRLARFKVPATVLFLESQDVPVTATGRVQKFILVDRAVDQIAQQRV